MKQNILYILSLAASLCLVACGGDDNDDNGGSSKANANTNANAFTTAVSAHISSDVDNDASKTLAISRLEFPKLQDDDNIQLLVHWDTSVSPVVLNYAVQYDKSKGAQLWTCYEMYKSILESKVSRYYPTDGVSPQYPADPLWQTEDLFYRSGYDHGHILPSADRLYNTTQNKQTFYLTNMQPQANAFNAGIWYEGESALRNVGKSTKVDTVYVCKGGTIGGRGTLSDQVLTTTDRGLLVPRYFFVAALSVKSGVYHSIGVLYDQKPTGTNADGTPKYPEPQLMTIDELEELTGFDFFCNLPDSREKVIESTYQRSLWGF